MTRGRFDVSRLPRRRLLEEAFPGQTIPDGGWHKFRCTLPGCEHYRGDQRPSLRVQVERGGFECLVSGRTGRGWKDFVSAWWSEERWREIARESLPDDGRRGRKPTVAERWAALGPEFAWTRTYGIAPELSARYLRAGVRYPGDPRSDSAIAILKDGELVGIKWRLPTGARWAVGEVARKDPDAKYALTKGSNQGGVLLGELAEEHPNATIVLAGGEKDALVSASHLDRARWAPIASYYTEGKLSRELRELCRGRRVVVALDGDDPGHWAAWVAAQELAATAVTVKVARLPIDTPPGARKPGWDLADVLLHRGPGELERILEAAGELPDDWRPPHLPDDWRPQAPARERSDQISFALDDWDELDGHVVVWKRTRAKKGEEDRSYPVCKFRGLPRVVRVRRQWTEDPDQPTGWLLKEAVTYGFRLAAGGRLEHQAGPGARAFGELLDLTELATATEAVSRPERDKLHLWTLQRSQGADLREERCALGPHGDHGWLAPPQVTVRKGKIMRPPYHVSAPIEAEEFRRYRFDFLGDQRFRQVSRWVVTDLLTCGHAAGGYTLPLLGAFLSAPLWEYIGELASWQRYAFFIQGPSGVGKTHLSRLFWSFWGSFRRGEGLTTWQSSATYLEALLHHARGVPVFVPDFKRANLARDAYRAGMALIQAYADRASRGRALRGSSELDQKRPPRCTWIIDGEDLPEGEQSTLGRLIVLEVEGSGESLRCASTDGLDERMIDLLPGWTARWVAYVQAHGDRLGTQLGRVMAELEKRLPRGSTNRSRLVRSYAVQVLSALAALDFLEASGGGDLSALRSQVWTVHLAMASRQLATVEGESAGEQFLAGVTALLSSGRATLRARYGETQSGPDPFGGSGHYTSDTIGTYHHGVASVWPSVALPLVQRHLTQGGGGRIEFSARAIAQQLEGMGVLLERDRERVTQFGGNGRVTTWRLHLEEIGGQVLYEGAVGSGGPVQ